MATVTRWTPAARRVYGLGDRNAVSHEQTTADADTPKPEQWRLERCTQ